MNLYRCALGIAALIGAASAANADTITYTLTGNTAAGSPFTIVGSGDTNAVFGFFGNVSTIPTVQLTTNTITIGANTGTILGSLYLFDNHTVGVAGFDLGLSSDIFNFSAPAFSTYNAVTPLAPTSVNQALAISFNTSFGSVNLNGASNLSFQAVVGAAVPEPGTWAMMLVGFGGIGLVLRARRRRFGKDAVPARQ